VASKQLGRKIMCQATAKWLKIGALARLSGVSARALRLYENVGVLVPTHHSVAGYRLYDKSAITQLLQIKLLQQAGFSLRAIATMLGQQKQTVHSVLQAQIDKLELELNARASALEHLKKLVTIAKQAPSLPIPQLLEIIKMRTNFELALTPEEHLAQGKRAEQLGEEKIAAVSKEWPELIARVRASMQAKTPVDAPEVLQMAQRWQVLLASFTGGDPAIAGKLSASYVSNPNAMAANGMDMEMFKYIGAAIRAQGLAAPMPP
jgi:MerR family transcriptional regulator, thiopeptide resistance regulator